MIGFFFFVFTLFFGETWAAGAGEKLQVQAGDVILIGLNCYSCRLIEDSTGAPFSHAGVVILERGNLVVAQALGNVHSVSIQQFLKLKRKNSEVALLRPRSELSRAELSAALSGAYQEFVGLAFDSAYLWDDERLYCSEFVAKLFNLALGHEVLAPKPIEYGAQEEVWRQLMGDQFNGGELGNSPADLWRDSFFERFELR